MGKALWTTIALIAAVAVLWLAGEQHRENCVRDDRTGCTVLPWSGEERADQRNGVREEFERYRAR